MNKFKIYENSQIKIKIIAFLRTQSLKNVPLIKRSTYAITMKLFSKIVAHTFNNIDKS